MATLKIKDLKKKFKQTEVLKGINLEIDDGDFLVLLGPSGCGKSTLLRMIAGLEEITEGEISIGGEVVNNIIAAERGVAMVFQSYALYPHMTVFDNMAFALKQSKTPKHEIQERVTEAAKVLQIETLFERLPKQLSGGQRQRVAIGRAIVMKPSILLADEPTGNLDSKSGEEVTKLLESLNDEGITLMIVTHDPTLGARARRQLNMLDGRIV